MSDLEKNISSLKPNYFSCLDKWKIEYPEDTLYRQETTCNIALHGKKATIYPWGEGEEPQDYLFHEQLHLAIKDLMAEYSHDKEETLIQEICKHVSIHNGCVKK